MTCTCTHTHTNKYHEKQHVSEVEVAVDEYDSYRALGMSELQIVSSENHKKSAVVFKRSRFIGGQQVRGMDEHTKIEWIMLLFFQAIASVVCVLSIGCVLSELSGVIALSEGLIDRLVHWLIWLIDWFVVWLTSTGCWLIVSAVVDISLLCKSHEITLTNSCMYQCRFMHGYNDHTGRTCWTEQS